METKLIDVVTYIEMLLESSNRFHQQREPYDFFDMNTLQLMYNRITPLLEDLNVDYRTYHQQYLELMKTDGWTYGETSMKNKKSYDLLPYDQLSQVEKETIAFRAGITSNIVAFYKSLRQEIEGEIMDQINHLVALRRVTN